MNFSRGVKGVFAILVKILEGWGGISSLQKWKIKGGGRGRRVLSEIPSVVGSGYFLELHNLIIYAPVNVGGGGGRYTQGHLTM